MRADNAAGGTTRAALFAGTRLLAAIYTGPAPVMVSRSWAAGLLARPFETPVARLGVLAGHGGDDVPEQGAIVCSCFGVGRTRILAVAAADPASRTCEGIGERLRAGTNCGSCRGEIAALLRAAGGAVGVSVRG